MFPSVKEKLEEALRELLIITGSGGEKESEEENRASQAIDALEALQKEVQEKLGLEKLCLLP